MIQSPLLMNNGGYCAGAWVGAKDGRTLAVMNPATGEKLAEVPYMGANETVRAIEAAHQAMAETASTSDRIAWLNQIADLLKQHRDELGRIITLEHGKPWEEAKAEVDYAAGFFRYSAKVCEVAVSSHTLEGKLRQAKWRFVHRPAGVAGLIVPWNFPIAMLAKKLSGAIAAGCATVAKPSELTPLTCIAFWHLLVSVPMPVGMVNLVMGDAPAIGQALCEHPRVRVISFTGSTRVGQLLFKQTAQGMKRLALELGGNAPFVVFADADLESAADHLIANKFRAGGQTCVCTNRVLVHQQVQQIFTELVRERMATLKMGDGMMPGMDIGPLINRAGWEKVARLTQDAIAQGAKCLLGGLPEKPREDFAAYFPPTLLVNVMPQMACCQKEIFGPVVPVITFETTEEALRLANDTLYGLAAYAFSADRHMLEAFVSKLHFGHVGINTGSGPTPEAPFGGMLHSGFGREGGTHGIHEFCEVQTIATQQ